MLLCGFEFFVFYIDTQVVTSGEYGNISESDGLHKIYHNF